ncbi:MAG: 2-amino-4-hydroxy-6-hydroxymethyldihydropteridine diphosphokinase [Nitrospirota bacterium]|nr:2-amino-4-hydroxy-6-hydroxymethyldihydropteridine diphosphokinase [Nitrospirota bacterium]
MTDRAANVDSAVDSSVDSAVDSAVDSSVDSAVDSAVDSGETVAFIACGSNLGDRVDACLRALRELNATPGITVARVSRLIETAPVGPVPQGPFINGVARLVTTLSAGALLARCLEVEKTLGRVRGDEEVRWGPRAIDLDVLLFGDAVIHQPGLEVPHPQMHLRHFVLAPLAEIAPDTRHPVFGYSVARLLAELGGPADYGARPSRGLERAAGSTP